MEYRTELDNDTPPALQPSKVYARAEDMPALPIRISFRARTVAAGAAALALLAAAAAPAIFPTREQAQFTSQPAKVTIDLR